MRRRRKPDEPMDSLDLLLDTICNTFGGVLFMAMLVSLLSGHRAEAPIDAEADARRSLSTLGTIEARERTLADAANDAAGARAEHDAAEEQARRVAERLGWPADKAVSIALNLAPQSSSVNDALNARAVLTDLAEQTEVRSTELARVTEILSRRKAEIAAAGIAAAEKAKRESVTLRLPMAHETSKRQNVAFISGGRLFAGVYPNTGFRGNGRLFRGTTDSGNDKSVRPGDLPDSLASQIINSSDAARGAVKDQMLDTLDVDSDYIMFAVWPDSYEAFRRIRDIATARGIGYGLLLLDKDEAVGFGETQGYEQ